MSDWAKTLLADVARETCVEVDNLMRLGSRREILAGVLERRLLGLLEAGQAMRREGQRLVDWLDKLTANAEREAKDSRFITLQEANAADAKNFRATAKAMREAIQQVDAAKANAVRP